MSAGGFFVEAVVLAHPRFMGAGAAASWLWVQCGIWSASEGHDGFVSTLAVRAYGTMAQARRLVEVGLWEEEPQGFRFLRWRNGHPTPETAPEEQRRIWREQKAAQRVRKKADMSGGHVRGQRADVRGHVREMSTGQSADTVGLDTASSLELPPLSPPQGEPTDRPAAKRSRGVQLPASWLPNAGHLAFATEHGLTLEAEVVRFRDHHLLKGTLGKDWDAGFRTWLRHAVEYRAKDLAAAGAAPAKSIRERYAERGL